MDASRTLCRSYLASRPYYGNSGELNKDAGERTVHHPVSAGQHLNLPNDNALIRVNESVVLRSLSEAL